MNENLNDFAAHMNAEWVCGCMVVNYPEGTVRKEYLFKDGALTTLGEKLYAEWREASANPIHAATVHKRKAYVPKGV